MRYVIKVSRGRKTILTQRYVTYDKAMDALDKIEARFAGYKISFKGTQPFGWGFGG